MCSETKSCSALANPRIITQNFIVQFLCKIKYSYKDAKIWNWTSTDKNTDIHLHFLSLTNKPHMKRMHVLTDWRVLAICCTTNRMSSSSCSNEGENAISPASFTSSMQSCGKSPLLDSSNRSTHEFMVRVSTSFSWRVAQIHLLVWLLFVYYAKRQHNTKKQWSKTAKNTHVCFCLSDWSHGSRPDYQISCSSVLCFSFIAFPH